MDPSVRNLIHDLHSIEAIKFGEFKLKSGIISPIYIDLRVTVSYPAILSQISKCMYTQLQSAGVSYDVLCGVPYTALTIASSMSLANSIPMVMRRKEAKGYGTNKIIEGVFKAGMSCLVIEDLVTTGGSVMETVFDLHKEGLIVRDVVVLVDRQQGGRAGLEAKGMTLHAVLTITQVLDELLLAGKLTSEVVQRVRDFIRDNQISSIHPTFPPTNTQEPPPSSSAPPPLDRSTKHLHGRTASLSYEARAAMAKHPLSKRLLELMARKKD
eukprot:TRINITY_DN17790_c0_g1_i1.p1 TRINITY_DN17790_c0_g1~~TRINITY_DN17790_c0_g1_i1.p1  ORF type:complete len:269 (+),score=58.06 TRINITY_DN17790_c0_g1_i1:34-840(+)